MTYDRNAYLKRKLKLAKIRKGFERLKTCILCKEGFSRSQKDRHRDIPYCTKHKYKDVGKVTFFSMREK